MTQKEAIEILEEVKAKVVYTADDEEPNCGQCDLQCGNCWTDSFGDIHDHCATDCGSEHGWKMYKRTVPTAAQRWKARAKNNA